MHTDNFNTLENKIKTSSDFIPKKAFINYISIPSLENIANANIVIKLWKCYQETLVNISLKNQTGFIDDKEEKFDDIASKVSIKLSLLPLPNLLKDELLSYIRPVGLEIMNSRLAQQYECSKSMKDLLDSNCWTLNGTIDEATTLKICLGHENIKQAYTIACENCLEDQICNLWGQMSKKTQEDIYCSCSSYEYACPLLIYWTYFNEHKQSELLSRFKQFDHGNVNIYDCEQSIDRYMFTSSMLEGFALAANYFWHHLTNEEIDKNTVTWACLLLETRSHACIGYGYQNTNGYADVLFFLLSQMKNNELQKEVLQKYSDVMLHSLFFNWPWQKYFLQTLQVMWDYLTNEVYIHLLTRVIGEIQTGRTTQMILRKLWHNSPKKFRNCFIKHLVTGTLSVLENLFEIEDLKTILLILSDADEEEKKDIICYTKSKNLCSVIPCGNLTLLENLIGEIGLSGEIQVRETIILNCSNHLYHEGVRAGNWQKLDKYIVWAFDSKDQRDTFKATVWSQILNDEKLQYIDFNTFKQFLHWCFDSNEKIDSFKKDISSFNTMESIILPLIRRGKLKFAEKLLYWCYSCDEKVCQFKNKLMLSDAGIHLFTVRLQCHQMHNSDRSLKFMSKLTQWFFPFDKVLKEFVKKFKHSWISDRGDLNMFDLLVCLDDPFDEKRVFLSNYLDYLLNIE